MSVDASDLQVPETDVVLEKIHAADWPQGARLTGLWIDQASVQQFGLTTSQLYMHAGMPSAPRLFAKDVLLSTPTPTISGFEGLGLGPGAGAPLLDSLQIYVWSDHLPLAGAVGHLDLHVVTEVATPF